VNKERFAMDQVYHDIYKRMYENYGIGPEFEQLAAKVRPNVPVNKTMLGTALTRIKKAIDEYEKDPSPRIRPDAKYFLMVNFFELILFPIIVAGEPTTNTDQLLEDADSDINNVLTGAAQSSVRDAEGLSSHSIIKSLNNAWDGLKLTDALHWMK
jgi:hypothetical protein